MARYSNQTTQSYVTLINEIKKKKNLSSCSDFVHCQVKVSNFDMFDIIFITGKSLSKEAGESFLLSFV